MSKLPPDITPSFITIGSIGRPYGIKGWFKINSFTEPSSNIIHYHPWYLFDAGKWQTISLKECKQHGNGLIAHFPGCDTPEQAKRYVNLPIGIKQSQLPALSEGEYYWADLIGLTVYNHNNQLLGKVDHLFETGANDVLVVKDVGREYLIPYVLKHIVLNIDLEKKIMTVHWDEDF